MARLEEELDSQTQLLERMRSEFQEEVHHPSLIIRLPLSVSAVSVGLARAHVSFGLAALGVGGANCGAGGTGAAPRARASR